MLSQIRQISDGNLNTVFVKNKEQKFALVKEIHDLECWKKSRSHSYRKEERELVNHLNKLRQQQDAAHHLDDGESSDTRVASAQRLRNVAGSVASTVRPSRFSSSGFDEHSTPKDASGSVTQLPALETTADKKALHRAEAHTNICVICQLPRRSFVNLGHIPPGQTFCCCAHEEVAHGKTRRFTTTGQEDRGPRHVSPVQVGQRRHSLMMARLDGIQHEYSPHPPGGHKEHGKKAQHSLEHHVHSNRHHVHHDEFKHHDHPLHSQVHHHHGHSNHNNGYHHDHEYYHVDPINQPETHLPHSSPHTKNLRSHTTMHQGHHPGYHGNVPRIKHKTNHSEENHGYETANTPRNSPEKFPTHTYHATSHHAHLSRHDPMYTAPHHFRHQYHSTGRRFSDFGMRSVGMRSIGISSQDSSNGSGQRDHEVYRDRHQACKLRGMAPNPPHKEQVDTEGRKSYPWSDQYETRKMTSNDIEDLKNCRYLRFSKLNLQNMKENLEEEVEVFKTESPS